MTLKTLKLSFKSMEWNLKYYLFITLIKCLFTVNLQFCSLQSEVFLSTYTVKQTNCPRLLKFSFPCFFRYNNLTEVEKKPNLVRSRRPAAPVSCFSSSLHPFIRQTGRCFHPHVRSRSGQLPGSEVNRATAFL